MRAAMRMGFCAGAMALAQVGCVSPALEGRVTVVEERMDEMTMKQSELEGRIVTLRQQAAETKAKVEARLAQMQARIEALEEADPDLPQAVIDALEGLQEDITAIGAAVEPPVEPPVVEQPPVVEEPPAGEK